MSQSLALLMAGVIGAVLGTLFHPGIPEILLVALILALVMAGVRALRLRRRAATG